MNLVLEPMITKAKRQLDEIFEHGTPEAKENVLLFLRLHEALYQLNDAAENANRIVEARDFVVQHLDHVINKLNGIPGAT